MDKKKIQKQIDKNRDLINRALELDDIELSNYIIRKLSDKNQKLINKLNYI